VPTCPICHGAAVQPFIDLGEVPLFCNVQWPTREQALQAPKAPLSLVACTDCGHVYNDLYDATLLAYSPGYDNTQHFSSTFRRYADRLVARLVDTHDIRGKSVVDIGCGRGDLLQLICSYGGNRGFGFDPSFTGARAPEIGAEVTISREYFGREQAQALAPSLVCCRHVLEHVPDPVSFLRTMHDALTLDSRPVLYLEVPNGTHQLRNLGLWDYIYEHVSYFSAQSLDMALRSAGFEVLSLTEDFGGQFLCAEVRPASGKAPQLAHTPQLAETISDAARLMNAKLAKWRDWAGALARQEQRAAVWGAGSKGVMFLNLLAQQAAGRIESAIDQNPNKHGQFVSGSAQQVLAPERLVESPVDDVVLMNEIYRQEVAEQICRLGVKTQLLIA
jgi:SAM-dependent methyltransferase